MSEWPKPMAPHRGISDHERECYQFVDVIPADLGRELYEALRRFRGAESTWEVLARYEKVVGE